MDILYIISSTTKEKNLGTKYYGTTFKKILKDGQRIFLILVIKT